MRVWEICVRTSQRHEIAWEPGSNTETTFSKGHTWLSPADSHAYSFSYLYPPFLASGRGTCPKAWFRLRIVCNALAWIVFLALSVSVTRTEGIGGCHHLGTGPNRREAVEVRCCSLASSKFLFVWGKIKGKEFNLILQYEDIYSLRWKRKCSEMKCEMTPLGCCEPQKRKKKKEKRRTIKRNRKHSLRNIIWHHWATAVVHTVHMNRLYFGKYWHIPLKSQKRQLCFWKINVQDSRPG